MPQQPGQPPLFFWRETESEGGFLSPWYICPFTDGSRTFMSAGHWITAEKAKLFNDQAAVKRILATTSTDQHRTIGRYIKNFDEDVWKRESYRLATQANFLKFQRQGPGSTVRERLLGTGDRELVNASPYDRLWGIGFTADVARRTGKEQWGENQYGRAVMEVRSELQWKSDHKNTAIFDTPGSGYSVDW